MNVILLGPPGAGKGTQAKLLSVELKLPHISTGDMFRDHKTKGTELGRKIQAIMDGGGLVTDDITNAMVKDRLAQKDASRGFILDGFPRTVAQAEFLEGLGRKVDAALSYDVPEEKVIERISGRRSCPKCGSVYHVSSSPPRKAGFCDKDDTGLVQRDDDKPENVKKRLQEYAQKTAPLKRWYAEKGVLLDIDGVGTPEGILAVTQTALAALR